MTRTLLLLLAFVALAGPGQAGDAAVLPPGGQALLATNPTWKLVAVPGISRVFTYERPAVSAGPIVQSATTNLLPTRDAWKTYILTTFAAALQPGDVVFVTGKARVLSSTNATGAGSLKVHLENSVPPDYRKIFTKAFPIQKDWTRFLLRAPVTTAVEAGKGAFIVNLGYEIQTVEICDLQLYRYPAGFDASRLPAGDP